jgi:hypothetical protein
MHLQPSVLGTLCGLLAASRRRRIEREVDALLALLGGVRDPKMRLRRFADDLETRPIAEAASALAHVVARMAAQDARVLEAADGLLDRAGLCRLLGEAWVEEVRRCLEHAEARAAALVLTETARRAGEDAPPPVEPVGVRVALARQPVRRLVERLLFDPEPRVVGTLLGNARLTEGDVVKLAASRRAEPGVLEAIARDGRWVARYPVKLALASNPATPGRIAAALLPYLLARDLRDLALTGPGPAVREQAASLLVRRGQP